MESERLRLRPFTTDDAAFTLELLNDPGWIRYIGDRNVRSLADAERYLEAGPIAMQEANGFSMWVVERKGMSPTEPAVPIGTCGLIKRDELDDVDLGFAFLPEFRGQGFAVEAAERVMNHAWGPLSLPRVVAITVPENASSIRLLTRLGFASSGKMTWPSDGSTLHVYAIGAPE